MAASSSSKTGDEMVGTVGSRLIGIFDHLTYSACIIVKLTTIMIRATLAKENTNGLIDGFFNTRETTYPKVK